TIRLTTRWTALPTASSLRPASDRPAKSLDLACWCRGSGPALHSTRRLYPLRDGARHPGSRRESCSRGSGCRRPTEPRRGCIAATVPESPLNQQIDTRLRLVLSASV